MQEFKIQEGCPVVRYGPNTAGRDLIVGDLHGSYTLLRQALEAVGFRPGVDRLFSVGDLIDRGPESDRCLDFLKWINEGNGGVVRGNHEGMLIGLYSEGMPTQSAENWLFRGNGMGWLRDMSPEWRLEAATRFAAMPIAIEIETSRGPVGIVHADVPAGLTWKDFTECLEDSSGSRAREEIAEEAVWSRTRIESGDRSGTARIGRVFVGHTILDAPTRLGNIFYLDTGAVLGVLDSDPRSGRLTIVDALVSAESFDRVTPSGSIISLLETPTRDQPFRDFEDPDATAKPATNNPT